MRSNNVNKRVLVERRECYIFVEKYLQKVCNSMDQTRVQFMFRAVCESSHLRAYYVDFEYLDVCC